jgi:YebC/PmpR family DNA-binding regulatory protein
MIDCLTDNKNRTASFVRSTLTKRGGNLGTDGSVSYLFKRKGVLVLDKKYDEEEIIMNVLDLDIEDFNVEADGYVIYTTPDNFLSVKDKLEELDYDEFITSEVTYIPDNYLSLDEEASEKAMNLIEELEDLDDVQEVYHNLEI